MRVPAARKTCQCKVGLQQWCHPPGAHEAGLASCMLGKQGQESRKVNDLFISNIQEIEGLNYRLSLCFTNDAGSSEYPSRVRVRVRMEQVL